ncbi:unnamed protein product [Echinostoma caproni]|uniref:Uncharacterized protein n=1 Tax=Echinostoma caproni TaxID=27848 RepID=A0A183A574_9TREM|nr:unnamed protein product [Echinostoma caproni]
MANLRHNSLQFKEEAGLLDRVADLEKRSAEQANELACLRSSLADCLRRIGLLESSKGTALCQTRSSNTITNKRVTHGTGSGSGTNRAPPPRVDIPSSGRHTSTKSRGGPSATASSPSARDAPLHTPHQRSGSKSPRLSSSTNALDRQSGSGVARRGRLGMSPPRVVASQIEASRGGRASPLHPTAWKPGGQAICTVPRDLTPSFPRKRASLSPPIHENVQVAIRGEWNNGQYTFILPLLGYEPSHEGTVDYTSTTRLAPTYCNRLRNAQLLIGIMV